MRKRKDPLDIVIGDLARAIEGLGIPWYLMGAQAVVIHGVPRATADIDITVDLGNRRVRELLGALARGGFRIRSEGTAAFVARTRVVPAVHTRSGIPIDIVLAGPGIEEGFLARAQRVKVGRRSVPVASVEDLAIMKLLAGRPKDIDDVVALLRIHRSTDIDAIRAMLRDLGALLDEDLAARLDLLLPRVRTRRRSPRR